MLCAGPKGAAMYGRAPLGEGGRGLYGPGEGIKQPRPSAPPPSPPPIDYSAPAEPTVGLPTLAFHVPGHGIPVTSEHRLQLQVRYYPASAAPDVTYEYVVLTTSGDLMVGRGVLPSETTVTYGSVTEHLADGWLISVAFGAANQSGLNYVARARATLQLPGVISLPHTVLLDGHLARNHAIAWPFAPGRISADDTYRMEITGADPAAGNNPFLDLPQGLRCRLVAVRATLVTNATVANRTPYVTLTEQTGDVILLSTGTSSQPASQTYTWVWSPGTRSAGTVGAYQTDVTHDWVGQQSVQATINIFTGSLQAGDNWQAITALADISIDPTWDAT